MQFLSGKLIFLVLMSAGLLFYIGFYSHYDVTKNFKEYLENWHENKERDNYGVSIITSVSADTLSRLSQDLESVENSSDDKLPASDEGFDYPNDQPDEVNFNQPELFGELAKIEYSGEKAQEEVLWNEEAKLVEVVNTTETLTSSTENKAEGDLTQNDSEGSDDVISITTNDVVQNDLIRESSSDVENVETQQSIANDTAYATEEQFDMMNDANFNGTDTETDEITTQDEEELLIDEENGTEQLLEAVDNVEDVDPQQIFDEFNYKSGVSDVDEMIAMRESLEDAANRYAKQLDNLPDLKLNRNVHNPNDRNLLE